jgi:hypothetical protein
LYELVSIKCGGKCGLIVPKIATKVAGIPQDLGLDNAEPDNVTDLSKSHSQALTNDGLEDLIAQLTQK